nr:hypothetical protein [uncultured Prevotella sp.]
MAVEIIATAEKRGYQKPSCTIFRMDTESMICGSVRSETDNEDLSGNQGDPWNTHQDD